MLLNAGETWGTANISLLGFYLYPPALASGIGAILLGMGTNCWRVFSSAFACLLGYSLVALLGSFLIMPPSSAYNAVLMNVSPFIFMALAGIVVGGGIGLFQRGKVPAGRYALAGMAGFILGWYVDRFLAATIVDLSPYDGYVSQIVIVSPTYFIYMLIPSLVYGLQVGICLGMAAYKKPETSVSLA